MHLVDLAFLAYCIYLPPLIILYIVEIYTILKPGSPFKGSYYILFVAGAITDLLMVGISFFDVRVALFPIVNRIYADHDCGICSQIRLALTYVCPFTQDLLNCFVALNRFTSIWLSILHVQIWKKRLPLAIAFSVILPLIIFGPSFARKVTVTQVDMGNYTAYYPAEDFTFLPWHNSHRIASIEMIVSSILIIILYLAAAGGLRNFEINSRTRKREWKLIKIGISNFFIMFPGMFFQLMNDFKFVPDDWLMFSYYQLGWIIDVKCFCSAVTILMINKPFRKYIIRSFKSITAKVEPHVSYDNQLSTNS